MVVVARVQIHMKDGHHVGILEPNLPDFEYQKNRDENGECFPHT